jgi:hypothetical protein
MNKVAKGPFRLQSGEGSVRNMFDLAKKSGSATNSSYSSDFHQITLPSGPSEQRGLRPEEQISRSIERYELVSRQAHRIPIHFSLLFDEVGYQETCISTL